MVVAVVVVAAIGLWCLVIIPAMWLSGTISQAEEDQPPVPSDNGD